MINYNLRWCLCSLNWLLPKKCLQSRVSRWLVQLPPASYVASVISQLRHPQERRQQHQRQCHGPSRHTATSTAQTSSQVSNTVAESSAPGPRSSTAATTTVPPTPQARLRVEGARRILDTHPHATNKTVKNTVGRFCNV